MESQFEELKRANEHEEVQLKKSAQEIEDLLIEIDNISRKIEKR